MFQVSCNIMNKLLVQHFAASLALLLATGCGADLSKAETGTPETPPTAGTNPQTPPSNPGNDNGACNSGNQNDMACIDITTGGTGEGGDEGTNVATGLAINAASCGNNNISTLGGKFENLFDGNLTTVHHFEDPPANNDSVIHCSMPAGVPSFKSIKLFAPTEQDCDLQSATLYIARGENAGPMIEECYLGAFWCIRDGWEEIGRVTDRGQNHTFEDEDGNETVIPYAQFSSSSPIAAKQFGFLFEEDSCGGFSLWDEHLISEIVVEP